MVKLKSGSNLKLNPKLIAFPYQQEAAESIWDEEFAGVFHEQGLGKTKIAIDIALHWLESKYVDSVLIVAKKTLIPNWERELKTHSHLKPVILTQSRKNNFHVFNGYSRVILANYEVVLGEFERFKLFLKSRDVGVILDESVKIKNPTAKLTKVFLELSDMFCKRIIMTGTPVANRPYDIWSQIWFLDQGKALGNDFKGFRDQVNLPRGDDKAAQLNFELSVSNIWDKISPFSVRETKNSGVISLPDKVYETITVDWEDRQYDLYCSYRDDLKAIVMRDGIPIEDKAENILKRLLRLVQIASNPKLVDQSYIETPGKLHNLLDKVEQIRAEGQKCVIWSCFNSNISWLANECKHFGTCQIHGKMNIQDRNKSVVKFLNNANIGVLVATPGAAKEGLTLTSANHTIFFDRGFSLDDYLQAQDRIHRISQKKTCYVYNLMMPDSIDQWVDVLLYAKQLAAQLAQGDIELKKFKQEMSYDFNTMIKEILNIEQDREM